MKLKARIKDIREHSYRLLKVGYCQMQYLLQYREPFAYTAGVYGWNFDAYDVNGVTICTGYRGMPDNKRMKEDHGLIEKYEKEAMTIAPDLTYAERKISVDVLLCRLLGKLKED